MSKNRIFRLSAMSAAVASVLVSGQVQAQQNTLEEVIVTASRRAESIQDIPLNISAISGTMLQDQRLDDLTDIARAVPGLTFADEGSRSTTNNIVMRGLNTNNSGPTGEVPYSTSGVGVYMGEIPLYVNLRTHDLERVEVLIGPQGTLYGSGTLAGAIRYIPNKPQFDEFTGEVRGDLYQNDEADDMSYSAGLTLNIPISDTFAIRANVDYNDDSGFIDYNYIVRESGVSNPQPDFNDPEDVNANLRSVEDADYSETVTARIALRWQPNDSFDATLSYWYQDYETGGRTLTHQDSMAHLVDIGDYTSALRYEEPLDRETELTSLEFTWDLGFAELTSATGYSTIDEVGQRDQTDLLLDFQYGYEEFPSFSSFTLETQDYENIVQEIRLVSQNDGGFNWIAGFFYNDIQSEDTSSEFTPYVDEFYDTGLLRPDSLEYFQYNDNSRDEMALYGELEYQWNKWTITVGARYYEYEEQITQGFDLPLAFTIFDGRMPDDLIAPDLVTTKTDDDGSLFKLNVAYEVSDEILTYGTISEGYRIGGVNSVPPCSGDETGNEQNLCAVPGEESFAPDTTVNYELGVRSTWLDQRLTVNSALYFIDWEDIQVAGATQNGEIPINVNGSKAESYGLELSVTALLTDNLTAWGTYAYNNAELTEGVPDLVRGDDVLDGDRLPGSPEHSASFSLEHVSSIGADIQLLLNYTAYYTGNIYTTIGRRGNSDIVDRDGNTMPQGWGEEISSYWLHNASATMVWNDLRAQLYVDNLANDDAHTTSRVDQSELRDIGSNDFALRSYGQYVTRPRTVGLKLTYAF
ncbi:MAG: TonB-dependent receptor [Halioglobus sp.]